MIRHRASTAPAPAPKAFAQRLRRESARCEALVQRAIASLGKQDKRVSLPALHLETRRLDPEGRGVAESTIQRNAICRAAYHAARPPLRRSRTGPPPLPARLHHVTKAAFAARLQACELQLRHCYRQLETLAEENAALRRALAATGQKAN